MVAPATSAQGKQKTNATVHTLQLAEKAELEVRITAPLTSRASRPLRRF